MVIHGKKEKVMPKSDCGVAVRPFADREGEIERERANQGAKRG